MEADSFASGPSSKKLLPDDVAIIAVNKLIQSCEVKILKVSHSNGSRPKAFYQAFCDVEVYPYSFPFYSLFQRTLKNVINHYRGTDLNKHSPVLPEDRDRQKKMDDVKMSAEDELIFQKLLNLFKHGKDVADALRKQSEDRTESDYAVKLAHHLLQPLSGFDGYKINNEVICRPQESLCGNESLKGCQYADTSMGHEMVWHGSADVLIGDKVNIAVCDDETEIGQARTPSNEDEAFESIEDKGMQQYRRQIIARTIVFSFLLNKEKRCANHSLIPTIAISRKEVQIYFYDVHHDMLLESYPMKLYCKDEFNPATMLALWLTVNHPVTCSGLTKGIVETNFTSDFLEKFSEDIKDKYKSELRFGNCANSPDLDEDFFTLSSGDRSKPLSGGAGLEDHEYDNAFNKGRELIMGSL